MHLPIDVVRDHSSGDDRRRGPATGAGPITAARRMGRAASASLSQTSTAAVLPGSIAAATEFTSSSLRSIANSLLCDRNLPISLSSRSI
jgi:hypothetical protein